MMPIPAVGERVLAFAAVVVDRGYSSRLGVAPEPVRCILQQPFTPGNVGYRVGFAGDRRWGKRIFVGGRGGEAVGYKTPSPAPPSRVCGGECGTVGTTHKVI